MILAPLVRDSRPLGSPWHPASGRAWDGRRQALAPGVWVLRTKHWRHASLLDTHSELPPPVVDRADVLRRSWIVPAWHEWALCGGMSFAAFFGAANDDRPTMKRSEITAARRICGACPVKRDCLDWALTGREQFGVWGGTSGRQRSRMRAEMRAGASHAEVVEDWFARWLET